MLGRTPSEKPKAPSFQIRSGWNFGRIFLQVNGVRCRRPPTARCCIIIIGSGQCSRIRILRILQISKMHDFYVFLSWCTRILEHWFRYLALNQDYLQRLYYWAWSRGQTARLSGWG